MEAGRGIRCLRRRAWVSFRKLASDWPAAQGGPDSTLTFFYLFLRWSDPGHGSKHEQHMDKWEKIQMPLSFRMKPPILRGNRPSIIMDYLPFEFLQTLIATKHNKSQIMNSPTAPGPTQLCMARNWAPAQTDPFFF